MALLLNIFTLLVGVVSIGLIFEVLGFGAIEVSFIFVAALVDVGRTVVGDIIAVLFTMAAVVVAVEWILLVAVTTSVVSFTDDVALVVILRVGPIVIVGSKVLFMDAVPLVSVGLIVLVGNSAGLLAGIVALVDALWPAEVGAPDVGVTGGLPGFG
jgi:hypothetical protein